MPVYRYRCPKGHDTEELRTYKARQRATDCEVCGARAVYIISAHHAEVDGIYSYAPNLGSPDRFERHRKAIKEGRRTIRGDEDP